MSSALGPRPSSTLGRNCATAIPAAVQAVARNVTFANLNENATLLTRTARLVLTDGDGGTSAAAN